MARIEDRLKQDLSKVEDNLETTVAAIKALINRVTCQYNKIRGQMGNRDNGSNEGSILGPPVVVRGENQFNMGGIHTNRYATKLEFHKF